MALIHFIFSKARRFYLPMGNPSGGNRLKGITMAAVLNCWQLCDDHKNDNRTKEKKITQQPVISEGKAENDRV